jgi:hypothetical protein
MYVIYAEDKTHFVLYYYIVINATRRFNIDKIMNISSSTSNTIAILLLSLQRICRNLTHLLNALDVNVDLFDHLLTQMRSTINESLLSSNIEKEEDEDDDDEEIEKNEDFYEQLFDEQLEPRPARVTTL